MTMTANGLAKLIEELGELTQVAGKKIAYNKTDIHPDGMGSLKERLEDEMGDVIAAIRFVTETLELDDERIKERMDRKFNQYKLWHEDPLN